METPRPQAPRHPEPRFSVIIPAYNAEPYLAETIASVAAQTWVDWELIVVDDGSTDTTREIAERLAAADTRIAVLHQPNAGCSSASNTGIEAARGEYICILGADDLYLPDYLAQQSRFIDAHPGRDIYSCNGLNAFPDGTTTPYFSDAAHAAVAEFTLDDWFESCPIFGLAIYRRDLAIRLRGYRTDLKNAEDYDFWIRAMSNGARHVHNPAVLALYRRHADNKSGNRVAAARAVVRILEDLSATATLTEEQRRHLDRVLTRRRAAIGRRELESQLLEGDFHDARQRFWASRAGYADRMKYALALLVVLASPRLYARLALRSGVLTDPAERPR